MKIGLQICILEDALDLQYEPPTYLKKIADPPFKRYDFLNGRLYDVKTCLPVAPDHRMIHLRSGAFSDAMDHTKETGHLWPYYIYMTVFIRNAANLAHILPKASRTTFTSEVFL
jgi:hypothetical protein